MRDDEAQEKSGPNPVPAALAGAAIYEGLPVVMDDLLGGLPHGLAKMVMSGKPIEAEFGTPLTRLAEFTRGEVKAIQSFAAAQGVKVPIIAAGSGLESGYFLDSPGPVRKLISRVTGDAPGDIVPHIGLSRSSVPHALHEIGHAAPIAGSDRLRRVLQGMAKTLGQGSTVGNFARAGIASNVLAIPDEKDSPVRRFLYDNAPALVGATMLPELLEEGRASLNALRGSRAHGPGILRTLAELGPAFGTYVASAAAPVLATILAKHVVAALKNAGQPKPEVLEEKTSAPRLTEVKAPGSLRTSASSAWQIGKNPPKPKTIGPAEHLGTGASGRAPAKPPSKTSYYSDMLSTLYNPQRGARIATPGG